MHESILKTQQTGLNSSVHLLKKLYSNLDVYLQVVHYISRSSELNWPYSLQHSTPFTSVHGSISKRKRNIPQESFQQAFQTTSPTQTETTPNPKPRKQMRNRISTLDSPTRRTPSRSNLFEPKSPHADNPNADYIFPVPSNVARRTILSARARRSTPIPAYEPPTD